MKTDMKKIFVFVGGSGWSIKEWKEMGTCVFVLKSHSNNRKKNEVNKYGVS